MSVRVGQGWDLHRLGLDRPLMLGGVEVPSELGELGHSDGDAAKAVDRAVLSSKPDSWVGNALKERKVKRAIKAALPTEFDRLDELFDLVRARDEYR